MSIKRVSRSAIVTRKQCEMKRYLQYEFRSTGIQVKDFVPLEQGTIGLGALPKVRGALFHEISLAIVEGASQIQWQKMLTEKATVFPSDIRKVQTTLIRRAMLGWEKFRGPYWKRHFDVISAEQAWQWHLSPRIVQPLRLDKILRRKDDGVLGIFDYKTMGSVDPNWIQRMELSDQTHLYVQALKEHSGEHSLGICYDGVVIGKWSKGWHRSPFVMGYMKNGQVVGKYSTGATAFDLCDYSDDAWWAWTEKAGIDVQELYPTTEFLNPPPAMLLHTKTATARKEEEWDDLVNVVEAAREKWGEQSMEYRYLLQGIEKNPEQCLKYGLDYACPFVAQCWRGLPFDSEFEPRVDHHREGDDE